MSKDIRPLSFDKFAANISAVFADVISKNKIVVVENRNGERAILKSASKRSSKKHKAETDYKAFRAAAGSWKDVDNDKFLKNNRESRLISSRSPVKL